jgi:cytochrome P450
VQPEQIEPVLVVVLLIIASLPPVFATRLVMQPGIRRRLRGFPLTHQVLIGAIVTSIVALIVAGAFFPALLVVAASGSLAIMAYELIARRSSFGMKSGLPPGSLELFSTAPWTNPDYYSDTARIHGTIFKFRHLTRPAIGMVGIGRIEEFLRTHSADLEVPPAPFNEIIPSGFVRYLEGDDHDQMASELRTAFSPTIVAHHCARLHEESTRAVSLIGSGGRVETVIDEMTFQVMSTLFFGTGGSTDGKLKSLFEQADYRRLSNTGRTKAARAVQAIIEEMRMIARDTGSISFLTHLVKHHPHAIDDDGILANLAYSLHTGRLDAAGLLHWLIAVAGTNQAEMQQLRDAIATNPGEAQTVGGLADRMVRETLRLHQSEFLMRRAKKEIQFQGYRMPAGWHVRLCIAESHRSPEAFRNPESFEPDRFLEPHPRSTYAPFGFTPRACPGEHLARAIGRHFIIALAQHPFKTSDVEPWEFTGFHWKPGSRMQVRRSDPS